MRRCGTCQIDREEGDFYLIDKAGRRPQQFNGRKCKGCQKVSQYGITWADYESMLEAQDGVCPICLRAPTGKRNLVIDHDHVTGKVRGLLCNKCNPGLGLFEDNPTALRNAIRYLERHK